jgi:hypothetical protein
VATASSEPEVLPETAHGLAPRDAVKALDLKEGWTDDESCLGTVELAETISVPPLSGRIARGRVVRRGDLMEFKAPSNQVIMVDPVLGLPGIYMARVVATLCDNEINEISPGVHGLRRWSEVPLGSKSAEQLNSPCGNWNKKKSSPEQAGSGESQPEFPPNRLQEVAVDRVQGVPIGLQGKESFLPVGNGFGNHADTERQNSAYKGTREKHTGKTGTRIKETRNVGTKELRKGGSKIMGYVPIQIINLSLEEVELPKHMWVGLASPTETCVGNELTRMQGVTQPKTLEKGDEDRSKRTFELYLNEKLGHLTERDRSYLELILRKYHIFYKEGSSAIGCTSIVKHKIDTGDAQPIKKNPYRTPHALKPVVEEHIKEMLQNGVIEPSISPWSSSIVLVKKKTTNGSVKYRFCVDYRLLNAVTKPDAYPIPNITDTLDSLGTSKIFSVLDMASGYHQIEIMKEDREKTAFSCHMGHYQFTKLPFGVNNGPATYQRCMDFV